MIRSVLVIAAFAAVGATARGADEPKGEKVEFTVHDGHFVKNAANLKEKNQFLLVTTAGGFDERFGVARVIGKQKFVPKDAFDTKVVVAAVKVGNFTVAYAVEKVLLDKDGKLSIVYTAKETPSPSATYGNLLLVTVPKVGVKKVAFFENGKEVGTAEEKKAERD